MAESIMRVGHIFGGVFRLHPGAEVRQKMAQRIEIKRFYPGAKGGSIITF